MINSILVFDTEDSNLGDFFSFCKDDLTSYIETTNYNNKVVIESPDLNEGNISTITKDKESFIFSAHSHGANDCLVVNAQTAYISTKVNYNSFNNSFFYTFSCSSGKVLGNSLIENGCRCFIGYNSVISIWNTYSIPFVRTANLGLKLFYDGLNTQFIYDSMIEQYNNEIDELYKSDFMIASILLDNRDSLIIYGEDITITDLETSS